MYQLRLCFARGSIHHSAEAGSPIALSHSPNTIAVHKLQSSMDGFLSRFTPKLRKMRSIKSQWHMWKPARRQSVRTAHEAPADGRKEDENAAAKK